MRHDSLQYLPQQSISQVHALAALLCELNQKATLGCILEPAYSPQLMLYIYSSFVLNHIKVSTVEHPPIRRHQFPSLSPPETIRKGIATTRSRNSSNTGPLRNYHQCLLRIWAIGAIFCPIPFSKVHAACLTVLRDAFFHRFFFASVRRLQPAWFWSSLSLFSRARI